MTQTLVKWARWAVIAGTAGAVIYLAINDPSSMMEPLLVGVLLLLGLNQLRDGPEGDAFDRALRAQLIGFGVVALAMVVVGVGLLVRLIHGHNAEAVGVLFIAGGITGLVVLARQGRRYFEAGGGGRAAIEVWRRDGLDAMRAYNEQRADDSDEDSTDPQPPPPDPSARISPP